MSTKIKVSWGERVFGVVNLAILLTLSLICLYPLLYILFSSLSDPTLLTKHEGLLLYPRGFSLASYKIVFKNPDIYIGYGNTLFYVVVGSFLSVLFTSIGAYVLSRPYLKLRKPLTLIMVFTMYFSGGLIPSYLLVQSLHMYDTRWAIIVPGLISTYNLLIMITSFRALPISLEESARLDGAGEWTILIKIFLPLSTPIIAVMFLYYGVGIWNSWFGAMIYLNDKNLFPLQLFLRKILILNDTGNMMASNGGGTNEASQIAETVKYSTVIIATAPILLAYPFMQKYFVKGVMIGSIKE